MILVKITYKTYNNKLFAIIKVFKTWYSYLKSWKYEVVVLIYYNIFRYIMDIKNLSF